MELVFLESEDQVVQVVVDVLDQDLLTEAQEEQELLEQLILVAAVEQEIIQDLLM